MNVEIIGQLLQHQSVVVLQDALIKRGCQLRKWLHDFFFIGAEVHMVLLAVALLLSMHQHWLE